MPVQVIPRRGSIHPLRPLRGALDRGVRPPYGSRHSPASPISSVAHRNHTQNALQVR